MYAVAAVVGLTFAVWSGVPLYYLILLACPVMMFFMMSSMFAGTRRGNDDTSRGTTGEEARTPGASRSPELSSHGDPAESKTGR